MQILSEKVNKSTHFTPTLWITPHRSTVSHSHSHSQTLSRILDEVQLDSIEFETSTYNDKKKIVFLVSLNSEFAVKIENFLFFSGTWRRRFAVILATARKPLYLYYFGSVISTALLTRLYTHILTVIFARHLKTRWKVLCHVVLPAGKHRHNLSSVKYPGILHLKQLLIIIIEQINK